MKPPLTWGLIGGTRNLQPAAKLGIESPALHENRRGRIESKCREPMTSFEADGGWLLCLTPDESHSRVATLGGSPFGMVIGGMVDVDSTRHVEALAQGSGHFYVGIEIRRHDVVRDRLDVVHQTSEICIGIPGCSTPTVPLAESCPGPARAVMLAILEDASPADQPRVDVVEVRSLRVIPQIPVGKLHHAADLRLTRRSPTTEALTVRVPAGALTTLARGGVHERRHPYVPDGSQYHRPPVV